MATLVTGSVIVLGLALWKIKLIVSLLFLAIVIAAAMRPASRGSLASGSRAAPA